MKQRKDPRKAASFPWVYVLIGALGVVAIVLVASLLYNRYQIPLSRTATLQPTAIAGPTNPRPWPTVLTATPTVTRPPSPPVTPTLTSTSTPRPTNTPVPTPTPTPTPILIAREELGKMVTIQYKLQNVSVVEQKDASWIVRLFGDNKIVLVATGEVMAGVDMTSLAEEDIVASGTTVKLIMPPAEILSVHLLPGESWVYDRKLNILKPNWQLELQAQQEAERSLREWSIDNGILEQAEQVFTTRIEALLRRLGFTDVTILFRGLENRR